MSEFEVTITETLKKTVTVEAESKLEAQQLVNEQWNRSEHVLDAEDFFGVEFEEEGKLCGMPLNRAIRDEKGQPFEIIAGTFFICGLGEEDFTSLPKELQKKYEDKFKQPETFLRMGRGKIMAIPFDPAKEAKSKPPKTAAHEER